MDPRDPLVLRLAGVRCAACDGVLPSDAIRPVARRDDLAFVELRCPACRTRTIGLMTAADDDLSGFRLDLERYGEFDASDEIRLADARPLAAADVEAVRSFLATWRGDFRDLLEPGRPQGAGPGR